MHTTAYLVNLHILEYCPNEPIRGPMPQRSTEYAHSQTNQHHIPKVKCRLNQPMHTRLENKVVNRIQEDIECRRTTRVESSPLPQIIFGIEAKVHHNYCRHAYH